jgi:hypothetical protein
MGRFAMRDGTGCASIAVATLLAALSLGHTARAQDPSALAAEALFTEGVQLMKANRCAEAADKFRQSEHLEPASGTLLDLAYCEVQLGHRANAWLLYRQAIPLARQNNKPEHEQIAKDQAAKLEGELGLLTVNVDAADDANLSVHLDGQAIARDLWSVPIPVDPGPHKVDVYSGDQRVSYYTVTSVRGQPSTLRIPRVSNSSAASRPPPAPSSGATPTRDPPKAEARRDVAPPRHDSTRTWAYVTGGVGVAALVGGSALFVSARLKYDSVADRCDGNVCDAGAVEVRRSAIARAKVSAGVLVAGVVLVGAGTVLWLEHPSNGDRGANALVLDASTVAWRRYW